MLEGSPTTLSDAILYATFVNLEKTILHSLRLRVDYIIALRSLPHFPCLVSLSEATYATL